MTEPPGVPGDVVADLLERIEGALLRGERKYTPHEVAERSGVELDEARRLWRSLGFASVKDDDVVFTDDDIAALQHAAALAEELGSGDELLAAMTRLLGQTFSRLATWQGQLIQQVAAERPEVLGSPQAVDEMIINMLDTMDQLHSYVWRRQLAAYLSRVVLQTWTDTENVTATSSVVGFADMAGFTTLTRKASERELRELLEAFESCTTEVVAAHEGRIVKTIGDEVLFVADTAVAGADISLDLIDASDKDPRLPPLRVGIAAGPVINRLGDVYGSTVNIASRLTALSRPGWVLVDRLMAEALRGDDRYELRARRPESVRGYHHLRQWRLRRADPVGDPRRRSDRGSRRATRYRGEVVLERDGEDIRHRPA